MKYILHYHDKINDDFDAIPLAAQARIVNAIDALADNPRPMGTRKLSGIGSNSVYRIRVGNYRVIYEIFDRELHVFIVTAGNRGSVYKTLKRRLRLR